MALTAAQKLKVKHHLGMSPWDTTLDNTFVTLAGDSDMQAELEAALTACDTAEAAIDTAQAENSDLIEGGGAKFDYAGYVSRAKSHYRRKINELRRVLDNDGYGPPSLGGGGAALTGWLVV